MAGLSLNNLARLICSDLGHGSNFTGNIPLIFNQGGLQRPKLSQAVKEHIKPSIRLLSDHIFYRQPGHGRLVLHVLNGTCKILELASDKTMPTLFEDEWSDVQGHRIICKEILTLLREYPDTPITSLITNQKDYQPSKTSRWDDRDGITL